MVYTENMQNDEQPTRETWQAPTEAPTGVQAQSEPELTPSAQTPIQPLLDTPDVTPEFDEEAALIRWQAHEYVEHARTAQWYAVFGLIAVFLMVIAIFLMKSWTFAILVPIMAVALLVYTRRPPAILDYSLTKKGLYVNEKFYPYDNFRAFSLVDHAGRHTVNLVPRKRFQLAQTISFPEEVGETLVDMLAARMPMQEAHPDIFDRITSRLRM